MGMELRPYELARAWTANGDRVTVLLGDRSHLRLCDPVLSHDGQTWREGGVTFTGFTTPPYCRNGVQRAKNVCVFCQKLWSAAPALARQLRPDVVIASSTHPFDLPAARRIAGLSGAALLFELHDIWPLSPMELYGYSACHPLMRLIDRAERRAVERSDAVVSILPRADRYFAERGIRPRRYRHVPNGAAMREEKDPPPGHLDRLDALRQAHGFVLLYAGGFSAANAVEGLIGLAAMLPDIGVAAVGDGPLRDAIARRAEGLKNFLLLDAVLPAMLPALLRGADLLWLGTQDLKIYRYGLAMNKLFDYMLAGRPILLAAPEGENPVEASGGGVRVPPSDLAEQAGAIQRLRAMTPQSLADMGERGREYVLEYHNTGRIASDYRRYMEEIQHARKKQAP